MSYKNYLSLHEIPLQCALPLQLAAMRSASWFPVIPIPAVHHGQIVAMYSERETTMV